MKALGVSLIRAPRVESLEAAVRLVLSGLQASPLATGGVLLEDRRQPFFLWAIADDEDQARSALLRAVFGEGVARE